MTTTQPLDVNTTKGRRGLLSRGVWTLADQAVSSISNAGLSVVVAKTVSADDFGAFALAFSLYSFLLGISQGVGAQPFMIRFSAADAPTRARAADRAFGAVIAISLILSGFLAIGALTCSGRVARLLIVLALFLPPLMLQDLLRTVLVTNQTPKLAFFNDLLWTLLQAVGMGGFLVAGKASSPGFLSIWGACAVAAAAAGLRQAGVKPVIRGARTWLSENWNTSSFAMGQWLAVMGATQLALALIAGVGSVKDVGAIRAAQTLLGPLNIITLAVGANALPELVRRAHDPAAVRRGAFLVSGVLVCVNLAWGGLLVVLPNSTGRQILGASWSGASDALVGMVLFSCGVAAMAGLGVGLKAAGRLKYTFFVNLVFGPMILCLSLFGLHEGGVAGAAYGFAAASLLCTPLAWWALDRALGGNPTKSPGNVTA